MNAKARNTDPHTSHEAAASVTDIPAQKRYILKALTKPRDDIQMIEAYRQFKHAPNVKDQSLRSRRSELVKEGLVVNTGQLVKTDSGRSAIVWQALL